MNPKLQNPELLRKKHDKMFKDKKDKEKGIPSYKAKQKGNALFKEGKHQLALK